MEIRDVHNRELLYGCLDVPENAASLHFGLENEPDKSFDMRTDWYTPPEGGRRYRCLFVEAVHMWYVSQCPTFQTNAKNLN